MHLLSDLARLREAQQCTQLGSAPLDGGQLRLDVRCPWCLWNLNHHVGLEDGVRTGTMCNLWGYLCAVNVNGPEVLSEHSVA